MKAGNNVCKLALFIVMVLGMACAAFGQATTGTLLGTVMDPSGATIPGASVVVANDGTGVSVTVETNASGNYVAPHLLPGAYTVTFSKQGFQSTIQKNIT
ncbi:MAG: carboxypeptidase regulatory-like domain-containing protein, partial [Acidobacteriota bacterium]|nr:carboxypeptidase regulatory-like domain-containing protein [Acidobacteriota bacterium]